MVNMFPCQKDLLSCKTMQQCQIRYSFARRCNGLLTISAMIMWILCCGIARCDGRQDSFSMRRSAFVHQMNVGSRGQDRAGSLPFSGLLVGPFDTRSDAFVTSLRPTLFKSSEINRDKDEMALSHSPSNDNNEDLSLPATGKDTESKWFKDMLEGSPLLGFFKRDGDEYKKPPPFQVEDTSLLFYDVFLILNLSLSISFWVVHRMSFEFVGSAVSEGSLFCLSWIVAGLGNGAFLYSAVDGHYGSTDERGGPKAAGLLGLYTFIGASNLRILVALTTAVVEHRKVGSVTGEQLIPLEIIFGLVLMSMWRALHSTYTPRV